MEPFSALWRMMINKSLPSMTVKGNFLGAPDPIDPQTSTPVKGKNAVEFHMMSYGEKTTPL